MSFIKYIKEERYKIIVTLITSFISFLIALLINTAIGNWNESKTHDSMLKAIRTEAESNRAALNGSFRKYYKDGIVLNEFSAGTVRQHLSNPLFVKHAKPVEIEVLSTYVRNLTLANAYRAKVEQIRLSNTNIDWLETILPEWEKNLSLCEESINEVTKLE